MVDLRVSTKVVPGRAIRLDLDDWDALIDVLRAGAKTFRVIADEALLSEPYDLESMRKPAILSLDIEAHEPYLRFRFGVTAVGSGQIRLLELATIAGDAAGEALFDRIEQIVIVATRDRPVADWWRESAAQRASNAPALGCAVLFVLFIGLCCAGNSWKSGKGAFDFRSPPNPLAVIFLIGTAFLMLFGSAVIFEGFGHAKDPAVLMTRGRAKQKLAKPDALE